MANDLVAWALPRLERLLPLDHDSLKQIIDYADSLPKDAAADHLKNLLGDSAAALEFISSFNSRRRNAPSQPSSAHSSRPASRQPSPPPRSNPKTKKRQQPTIHSLPARQVEGHGNTAGAYVKQHQQEDYMSASRPKDPSPAPPLSSKPALSSRPSTSTPKPSRTSSPAPHPHQQKTTLQIPGGQPMSGASSVLSDLDSAIRALELQTNPTLSASTPLESRRCGCMATTHALLAAAPNCLSCGNIVCVKQGLGPCVGCGAPLLGRAEAGDVLRVLKEERGRARQAEGNKGVRRAEVAAGKPRAFSGREFLKEASPAAAAAGLASATEHRDRLLGFQAQNAKRTTVHDEVADYALPVEGADGAGLRGGNVWASPAERALELKKQQKAMREWEFHARPEWERKKVVASIDLVKGKVVRRFVQEKFEDKEVEQEQEQVEEEDREVVVGGGGAFSRNPLLGKMIRPVFKAEPGAQRGKTSTWRRVQDDLDDNEDVILDGGTRGFSATAQAVA